MPENNIGLGEVQPTNLTGNVLDLVNQSNLVPVMGQGSDSFIDENVVSPINNMIENTPKKSKGISSINNIKNNSINDILNPKSYMTAGKITGPQTEYGNNYNINDKLEYDKKNSVYSNPNATDYAMERIIHKPYEVPQEDINARIQKQQSTLIDIMNNIYEVNKATRLVKSALNNNTLNFDSKLLEAYGIKAAMGFNKPQAFSFQNEPIFKGLNKQGKPTDIANYKDSIYKELVAKRGIGILIYKPAIDKAIDAVIAGKYNREIESLGYSKGLELAISEHIEGKVFSGKASTDIYKTPKFTKSEVLPDFNKNEEVPPMDTNLLKASKSIIDRYNNSFQQKLRLEHESKIAQLNQIIEQIQTEKYISEHKDDSWLETAKENLKDIKIGTIGKSLIPGVGPIINAYKLISGLASNDRRKDVSESIISGSAEPINQVLDLLKSSALSVAGINKPISEKTGKYESNFLKSIDKHLPLGGILYRAQMDSMKYLTGTTDIIGDAALNIARDVSNIYENVDMSLGGKGTTQDYIEKYGSEFYGTETYERIRNDRGLFKSTTGFDKHIFEPASQMIGSVAAFMIESYMLAPVAKVVSSPFASMAIRTGMYEGRGALAVNTLSKGLAWGSKWGPQALTGFAGGYVEGMMVGDESFKIVYNDLIERGYSHDEAYRQASKAKTIATVLNTALIGLNNTYQLRHMFKGGIVPIIRTEMLASVKTKIESGLTQELAMKETVSELFKKYGTKEEITNIIKETFKDALGEGFEESFINTGSQLIGEAQTDAKRYNDNGTTQSAFETLTSWDNIQQGIWGFVGGASTNVVMNIAKPIKSQVHKQDAQGNLLYLDDNGQETTKPIGRPVMQDINYNGWSADRVLARQTIDGIQSAHASDLYLIKTLENELGKLAQNEMTDDNIQLMNNIKTNIFNIGLMRQVETGLAPYSMMQYEQIASLNPEDAVRLGYAQNTQDVQYKDDANKAINRIQTLLDIKDKYQKLFGGNTDIFDNVVHAKTILKVEEYLKQDELNNLTTLKNNYRDRLEELKIKHGLSDTQLQAAIDNQVEIDSLKERNKILVEDLNDLLSRKGKGTHPKLNPATGSLDDKIKDIQTQIKHNKRIISKFQNKQVTIREDLLLNTEVEYRGETVTYQQLLDLHKSKIDELQKLKDKEGPTNTESVKNEIKNLINLINNTESQINGIYNKVDNFKNTLTNELKGYSDTNSAINKVANSLDNIKLSFDRIDRRGKQGLSSEQAKTIFKELNNHRTAQISKVWSLLIAAGNGSLISEVTSKDRVGTLLDKLNYIDYKTYSNTEKELLKADLIKLKNIIGKLEDNTFMELADNIILQIEAQLEDLKEVSDSETKTELINLLNTYQEIVAEEKLKREKVLTEEQKEEQDKVNISKALIAKEDVIKALTDAQEKDVTILPEGWFKIKQVLSIIAKTNPDEFRNIIKNHSELFNTLLEKSQSLLSPSFYLDLKTLLSENTIKSLQKAKYTNTREFIELLNKGTLSEFLDNEFSDLGLFIADINNIILSEYTDLQTQLSLGEINTEELEQFTKRVVDYKNIIKRQLNTILQQQQNNISLALRLEFENNPKGELEFKQSIIDYLKNIEELKKHVDNTVDSFVDNIPVIENYITIEDKAEFKKDLLTTSDFYYNDIKDRLVRQGLLLQNELLDLIETLDTISNEEETQSLIELADSYLTNTGILTMDQVNQIANATEPDSSLFLDLIDEQYELASHLFSLINEEYTSDRQMDSFMTVIEQLKNNNPELLEYAGKVILNYLKFNHQELSKTTTNIIKMNDSEMTFKINKTFSKDVQLNNGLDTVTFTDEGLQVIDELNQFPSGDYDLVIEKGKLRIKGSKYEILNSTSIKNRLDKLQNYTLRTLQSKGGDNVLKYKIKKYIAEHENINPLEAIKIITNEYQELYNNTLSLEEQIKKDGSIKVRLDIQNDLIIHKLDPNKIDTRNILSLSEMFGDSIIDQFASDRNNEDRIDVFYRDRNSNTLKSLNSKRVVPINFTTDTIYMSSALFGHNMENEEIGLNNIIECVFKHFDDNTAKDVIDTIQSLLRINENIYKSDEFFKIQDLFRVEKKVTDPKTNDNYFTLDTKTKTFTLNFQKTIGVSRTLSFTLKGDKLEFKINDKVETLSSVIDELKTERPIHVNNPSSNYIKNILPYLVPCCSVFKTGVEYTYKMNKPIVDAIAYNNRNYISLDGEITVPIGVLETGEALSNTLLPLGGITLSKDIQVKSEITTEEVTSLLTDMLNNPSGQVLWSYMDSGVTTLVQNHPDYFIDFTEHLHNEIKNRLDKLTEIQIKSLLSYESQKEFDELIKNNKKGGVIDIKIDSLIFNEILQRFNNYYLDSSSWLNRLEIETSLMNKLKQDAKDNNKIIIVTSSFQFAGSKDTNLNLVYENEEDLNRVKDKTYTIENRKHKVFTTDETFESFKNKRNKYTEGIYYPIKGYISDLIEPLIPKIVEDNNEKLQKNIPIGDDVSELFESNPELANSVYEALGFESEDYTGIGIEDLDNLIDDNLNVNWALLDKLQEELFSKEAKWTLKNRPEKHSGEKFTWEHIQNVVESAKKISIPSNVDRKTLILAALLHDIGKPYRNEDHALDSVKVINRLFKDNKYSKLVKLAVRYHMISTSTSQEEYKKIVRDVERNKVKSEDFIELLLALNIADITRNREENVIDDYSGKSIKNTLLEEIPFKRKQLETISQQQKQQAISKFQEYINATGRQDIEGFKKFIDTSKIINLSQSQKEYLNDLTIMLQQGIDMDEVMQSVETLPFNQEQIYKLQDLVQNNYDFLNDSDIKYQLLQYKDINIETYNNVVNHIEKMLNVSFNRVSLGNSVYGYNRNNELYLNTDMISADTPIHEALGHPVITYIKENNIELYRNLSNWIKSNLGRDKKNGIKSLYNKIKYASRINNINMSENNLVEEVMVNYLSRLLTNKVLNNLNKDVQDYNKTFDDLIQGYIDDQGLDLKLISSNINISQLANILFYNQNISRILEDVITKQKQSISNNINYQLKLINALVDMNTLNVTRDTFKKDLDTQIERNTIRLNTKEQPYIETNIRKTLLGRGVPNNQIDIMFDYMKSNNIQEISTEQLVLDLTSNYSYSVEINTAKEGLPRDNPMDFTLNGINYSVSYYSTMEEDFTYYYKNNDKISYDEYEKARNKANNIQVSTSHYSNLTVPGGTNYTENAIRIPGVVNIISANGGYHDNDFNQSRGDMAGWFRSDDKVLEGTQPLLSKEEALQRAIEDDNFLPFDTDNTGGEPTKTRRILEMQSFFQKVRGNDNLINKRNISYPEDINKIVNTYLDGQPITDKDKELAINYLQNEDISTKKFKANQFLQLLNKDSNWVTFFIKSIIQDSAKKGYEKVLFPKGETAAKIEGHQTIADEIRRIDKQIEELNTRGLTTEDSELPFLENGKLTRNKEDINKEIKRLEEEKSNLKSQGIEKLKPIEAFYEIKVGNILEKLFGKDNVKTVTDEYGNQWREIDLNVNTINKVTNIQLQSTIPIKSDLIVNKITEDSEQSKYDEDPKEIALNNKTVYRGVSMDSQYSISENGDLILNTQSNFDGKTNEISFTPYLDTAMDYATRSKSGTSKKVSNTGIVITIKDIDFIKQLEEQSYDELIYKNDIVISKGSYSIDTYSYTSELEDSFEKKVVYDYLKPTFDLLKGSSVADLLIDMFNSDSDAEVIEDSGTWEGNPIDPKDKASKIIVDTFGRQPNHSSYAFLLKTLFALKFKNEFNYDTILLQNYLKENRLVHYFNNAYVDGLVDLSYLAPSTVNTEKENDLINKLFNFGFESEISNVLSKKDAKQQSDLKYKYDDTEDEMQYLDYWNHFDEERFYDEISKIPSSDLDYINDPNNIIDNIENNYIKTDLQNIESLQQPNLLNIKLNSDKLANKEYMDSDSKINPTKQLSLIFKDMTSYTQNDDTYKCNK